MDLKGTFDAGPCITDVDGYLCAVMTKINIAIDGYSGTGKSSTAKEVASRLGYTTWIPGRCIVR